MIPLWEDQIHNGPFIQSCTHIWSDDVDRNIKSGVWDYYVAISKEFDKPLVNQNNVPDRAVIFIGMCHLIENILSELPTGGTYILVHRTNDRSFTQAFFARRQSNVKHIYTVDCQVYHSDVSAIPFGNASINGNDNLVSQIAIEPKRETDKRVFVCYNTNPKTIHRNESIPIMQGKDFAFVYELEYPHKQMAGDEFYRNIHAHEFTMALAGCGADASRQWASIQLGSIPIVTDCPEMRHFEDMPLVFCPSNMNNITNEWLDSHDIKSKSTDRMRASYWQNNIKNNRKLHGI